ncbi:MAG: DUF3592 domain-containing protein [Acidobacteriota bacterium]|nr:DUF3592 domain-containing protein [Acidobacteriota bacterium]
MSQNIDGKDTRKGLGCLILFALPFAAIGVVMAVLIGMSFWESYQMRQWVEVPAVIEDAQLETHRGDDSTSYSVTARYTYRFEGASYESTKVGIHSGSDNIGSYQERMARRLERYRDSGDPYRAFVNPEDPSQAVLDREVRWEKLGFYALFMVTFGGVGFGLIIFGFIGTRRLGKQLARQTEDPGHPWRWREDWADKTIQYTDRAGAIGWVIFALLWNAVSSPILFVFQEEWESGNHLILIGLLFPLVGIWLVFKAIQAMLRWRRYGVSTLHLEQVPIAPGEQLGGRVVTSAAVDPANGFDVTLSAVHSYSTGSGKNRSTRKDTLWEDQQQVTVTRRSRDGVEIPVAFKVPEGVATTGEEGDHKVVWLLQVKAAVAGVDYHASFDLPVFALAEDGVVDPEPQDLHQLRGQRSSQPLPSVPLSGHERAPALARSGAKIEASGTGRRFRFGMARNPGVAIGATIFWLIWSGVTFFLYRSDAPWGFPLVFGIFALLLLWWVLELWLRSYTVHAESGWLQLTKSLLGIRSGWRMPVAEIDRFEIRRGMKSGQRQYYNLYVRSTADEEHVVASQIPGRKEAQAVVDELEELLGLESSGD